ncbi:MAG: aryl-sulfate sulfotransferase [Deltaproteobacteria bacterium]|nr:aryl-sulfate sulfotransferase [Deltaproteobacteria bacterium]
MRPGFLRYFAWAIGLCFTVPALACSDRGDETRATGTATGEPTAIETRRSAPETPDPPEPSFAISPEERAALEAIGYVPAAPTDNPDQRGVTTREGERSRDLNIYGSRDRAEALLTDMQGEVMHRWAGDASESWMHIEPLPDGGLLTITRDANVAKHSWDGEVLWERRLRAHHDLAVGRDGAIFVLIRGRTSLSHAGTTLPALCDSIVVLSADGEVQRTVPLLALLRPHLAGGRLGRMKASIEAGRSANDLLRPGGLGDVLHTNSIAFLVNDIEGVAPAGSVLLSHRAISRITILAADLSEVLFVWGAGELDGNHDATALENGHLMVFDNGLKRGSPSRVVEVDPVARAVVWSYGPPELYTRLRGGAQALPNGNVLITESDRGHALEVSRDGETVWEFWNPDVRGSGDEATRATIYRLNRFPMSFFAPLQP